MTYKDGGPAFARVSNDYTIGHPGMTLRDWFAGQALADRPEARGAAP